MKSEERRKRQDRAAVEFCENVQKKLRKQKFLLGLSHVWIAKDDLKSFTFKVRKTSYRFKIKGNYKLYKVEDVAVRGDDFAELSSIKGSGFKFPGGVVENITRKLEDYLVFEGFNFKGETDEAPF